MLFIGEAVRFYDRESRRYWSGTIRRFIRCNGDENYFVVVELDEPGYIVGTGENDIPLEIGSVVRFRNDVEPLEQGN